MRAALAAAAVLALIGVVMGKSHEPVPVAPDAPRAEGVAVATFALG